MKITDQITEIGYKASVEASVHRGNDDIETADAWSTLHNELRAARDKLLDALASRSRDSLSPAEDQS